MLVFIKKNKVLLIFILFFIFLLFQHQFVWMYHDDYGYGSLTYAYDVGNMGHNFKFNQLIEYLIGHYNNWGGRVLCFFVECVLLGVGIHAYRFVQSIVIFLIFYMIYKIVSKTTGIKDWKIALATIISYGFIEIMTIRDGLFWASASIAYVFPLLPFLVFIYFYSNKDQKKYINSKLFLLINIILVFVSAFSYEQISIMVLFYLIFFSLYDFNTKRTFDKRNAILILIAFIGLLILILAPGNQARINHPTSIDFYKLSLLEKLITNIPAIVLNLFSQYNRLFIIVYTFTVSYVCMKNLINKTSIDILNKISLISIGIIAFFTIGYDNTYFGYIYNLSSNLYYQYFTIVIYIIQLCFITYSLTIYFNHKKEYIYTNIFYCSLIGQCLMLIAPYYPLRASLPFIFMSFILIIKIFTDIYIYIKNKNLILYILIPLFCVSFLNYITITRGYYLNNNANKSNDFILKMASKNIKSGMKIEYIKLNKLPEFYYSGSQPYINGTEYILIWIKKYYDIPQYVEIIYE